MAISSIDDLIKALTATNSGVPARESRIFHTIGKSSGGSSVASPQANATSPPADTWADMWAWHKSNGQTGADPSSGTYATCDVTTQGALRQYNASGGRTKYLAGYGFSAGFPSILMMYDRLVHGAGLLAPTSGNGLNNTAQSITTASLSRHTSGVGVEIWFTILSSSSTSPGGNATVTSSYTNQAGTGGKTTKSVIIPNNNFVTFPHTLYRLPRADGDTGVKSVQSVTVNSGNFATAGTLGIILAYPYMPVAQGGSTNGAYRDFVTGFPQALPAIEASACLAYMWKTYQSSSLSQDINIQVDMVEA